MSILDRFSLAGRVALVTAGAGPLFGRSISHALAEAGATVITASRSAERNEQFAQELRDLGHQAVGMTLDVCDEGSILRLHEQVLAQYGRVDVLVNSALAREGHAGGFEQQGPEQWRAAAEGDFSGLFLLCQKFIGSMVQQGGGSVINIASIYGVVSNDPRLYEGTSMQQPPSYNFVKAGMINFTRYLACYYGRHGVRVNAISPGGYYNEQPEPFVVAYNQRVPLGRMLGQEDIQGAVVFLASDASQYVTGTNLLVDGGWTAL